MVQGDKQPCACKALVLLLCAALVSAPAAAVSPVGPANRGIPPSLVGVWSEERPLPADASSAGAVATILSRQWLASGDGLVTFARVAGNGSLVKGGFVKDRFLGWECAAEANVTRFFVDTTDYDLDGKFVRTRTLCLLGVVEGGELLSYNYTLASDGCPQGHELYRARRVPTELLPGVTEEGDGC